MDILLTLTEEKITKALLKVELGLGKYIDILSLLHSVDVSESMEFQKAYNGFYRMRQRSEQFYSSYYTYMDKNKLSNPSFEQTLNYIYEELGRTKASFASKLVATINPDLPVWDSVVLNNLGIKTPAYGGKNRRGKIIDIYNKIIDWYESFLVSEDGGMALELFERHYPNTSLTSLKKVDLILWQIRD